MTFTVSHQGSLDGLCGLYAISNALMICGIDDGDQVIRAAAAGLAKSRWPDVIFDGTTFADMQKMLKSCRENVDLSGVEVGFPFKRNPPTSNDVYWERFDEIFSDERVRCAIIGVEEPFAHWIVAGQDGGRVQFLDSTAGKPFIRKNRADLHAGLRRKKPTQWRISRQELITFSVR